MAENKRLLDAKKHVHEVRCLFVKFALDFEECACEGCLSNLLKAALALGFAMEEEQEAYAKEMMTKLPSGADIIVIQT